MQVRSCNRDLRAQLRSGFRRSRVSRADRDTYSRRTCGWKHRHIAARLLDLVELLDEHRWDTRDQLANAIFDWIEIWYNPRRRHGYCNMLSPIDYETANRGMITTTNLSAQTWEP